MASLRGGRNRPAAPLFILRTRLTRRSAVRLLGMLLITLALAAPDARAADRFRIGSKNFTEQLILGEIYAEALEGAGLKVERKLNLGGTLVAHQALLNDQIDMYPEYTGT